MSSVEALGGKTTICSFRTQVFCMSQPNFLYAKKLCVYPTNYELVCIRIFICENNLACDVINLVMNDNKSHETLNPSQEILLPITLFLSVILFSHLSPYYSLDDTNYTYNPFLSPTLKFPRKYLMLFLVCNMLVREKRKRFTHPITIWVYEQTQYDWCGE